MRAMVDTSVSTEGGALVTFGAFGGWIARRRPVSAGRRIHSKRFGRVHRRGHPCKSLPYPIHHLQGVTCVKWILPLVQFRILMEEGPGRYQGADFAFQPMTDIERVSLFLRHVRRSALLVLGCAWPCSLPRLCWQRPYLARDRWNSTRRGLPRSGYKWPQNQRQSPKLASAGRTGWFLRSQKA